MGAGEHPHQGHQEAPDDSTGASLLPSRHSGRAGGQSLSTWHRSAANCSTAVGVCIRGHKAPRATQAQQGSRDHSCRLPWAWVHLRLTSFQCPTAWAGAQVSQTLRSQEDVLTLAGCSGQAPTVRARVSSARRHGPATSLACPAVATNTSGFWLSSAPSTGSQPGPPA